LNGIDKQIKAWIRVGVYALVWAIWNCRNEVVFNRFSKLIFFAGYPHGCFFDSHVVLPLVIGAKKPMDTGCNRLMVVVQAIFSQGGWLHTT
jgi:hypothetical protein